MRCLNNRRLYIFLIAALFSTSASATVYNWTLRNPNGVAGGGLPSPAAGCAALSAASGQTHVPVATSDPRTFNCSNSTWWVYREGTTCQPGATYNQETGSCDAPLPSDGTVCHDESVTPPRVTQGGVCVNLGGATPQTQCKYFAGTGNVQTRTFWIYEGTGSTSDLTVQNLQDKTGCEIAPTGDIKPEADCKYFPPTPAVPYFNEGVLVPGTAQPGAYRCKASSALTGNYTPPSNANGQKPSDTICADPGSSACTLPEIENKKEQKPCAYSTDSQGNQVCVSSKFEATQGKTKCGYVGSEFKCSEDLNKAVGEGLSIATKIETKPQPDGKTKEVKTDVQTATSCKGTVCTTKTTTTTTTTIKGSGGTTESISGTCTGDNCPDKNTNPDGDGDGFGDCTGSDCGEEEGGGSNDWYTPGEDTYASVIEDFAATVSGLPVVAGVDNFLTFTPSGACPVYNADVWVFSVRLDQWCTESLVPWELIKAVILGCCAFFAFRIAFM